MARVLQLATRFEQEIKQKWGEDVLQQHRKIWYKTDQKLPVYKMQYCFSYSSASSALGEVSQCPHVRFPFPGRCWDIVRTTIICMRET